MDGDVGAEQLTEALTELARAREAMGKAADDFGNAKAALERTAEHIAMQEARSIRDGAAVMAKNAELNVRELSLREWELTGDKHPGGRVTIREGKSYEVDEDTVTLWARDVAPILLRLDRDKAVKYAANVGPVPGIEMIASVTAAIDGDLSGLLKEGTG